MRKHVLFILSVLLITSMVMSACGGATPTEEQMVEEPAVEEPAEEEPMEPAAPSGKMVFMVQEANQDVFEQTVLPAFQEEYPDVEIEWINHPPAEVANQVALAIQGGTGAPDLAVTENASISRLVELGGLMDLTDKVQPYLEFLNPTILELCSQDGKIYCVPWDFGPVVTYYRRDIFEAAGLPTDPEEVSQQIATWDDFLATCVTIKDETGLPCFALNKANNYGDYFFNMLWQQGLGFYNEENQITMAEPEVVATMEKLGQFWEADVVSDSLEWTDQWYAELNAPMDDPNTPPVATIVIAGWMGSFLKSWIAPDQAGNWGIAEMPAFEAGGTRSANQGGSSYFIPEQSQNKEAAWAFIEFVNLDPDNHIKHFAYSDYFPAVSSTYDDPLFQEPDPYFADQATRALYAKAAAHVPTAFIYGAYAAAMRGAAATALQNYALGNMTAEEALLEAAESVSLETGFPIK